MRKRPSAGEGCDRRAQNHEDRQSSGLDLDFLFCACFVCSTFVFSKVMVLRASHPRPELYPRTVPPYPKTQSVK